MALPEPSSEEEQKGSGSAETNVKPGDKDDKDFDPTAEQLIDDIDDERTLEEEEALDGNAAANVQEELDDLKKESEMPIEDLLAYYEKMRQQAEGGEEEEEEEEEDDEEEDDEEDEEDEDEAPSGPSSTSKHKRKEFDDDDKNDEKDSKKRGTDSDESRTSHRVESSSSHQQALDNAAKQGQSDNNVPDQQALSILMSPKHAPQLNVATPIEQTCTNDISPTSSKLPDEQPHLSPGLVNEPNSSGEAGTSRRNRMTQFVHIAEEDEVDADGRGIYKTFLGYDLDDDSDDLDEDYSYTDDENEEDDRDWRREIHVGPAHQADVPDSLSEYDDLPPYENEDTLVWRCKEAMSQESVLDYLKKASQLAKRDDICISPASVPKFKYDNMQRLYRERKYNAQVITSTTANPITPSIQPTGIIYSNDQNHITSTTEQQTRPIDNYLPDIYMSQSRKQARYEYLLEQENAMDGINQACGITQNHISSLREENSNSTSTGARPDLSTEEYFQDEEQLLYLLSQCNYNFTEALRRRELDPFKYFFNEPMSLWSQEECTGFEQGLRTYGKDFRLIRENKVQTRTHAEVVGFYYLWKKSERHDVYTNQYRLYRKRCLSHPGTTDYMDKFIEDNEAILNASSSPTPTPTESTIGADSNLERNQQLQANNNNNFPLNRQQVYLQPVLQDTLILTHSENDACPENKCPIGKLFP